MTGDKWVRWDTCWKGYLAGNPNETSNNASTLSVVSGDLTHLKSLYTKIYAEDYNFARFLVSKIVKIVHGARFRVSSMTVPQKTKFKAFVKHYYLARLNYKYYSGAKEHFNRTGFNHLTPPYRGFFDSFSGALDHKINGYDDVSIDANLERILTELAAPRGGRARTTAVRPTTTGTTITPVVVSQCTNRLTPIYPKFGSGDSDRNLAMINRRLVMSHGNDINQYFDDSFEAHSINAAKVGFAPSEANTLDLALGKLSPACVLLAGLPAPDVADTKKTECEKFMTFMNNVCGELFDQAINDPDHNPYKLTVDYKQKYDELAADRAWGTHWLNFQNSLSD